ncbi:hypothetical protein ACWEO9_25345, partial [Streptomyces albidoflavus]
MSTAVCGGVRRRSLMDQMRWGSFEKDRPVAPGQPARRVSPVRTVWSFGRYRLIAPTRRVAVCAYLDLGADDGDPPLFA